MHFVGPELNHETWDRLYHETRMNAPHYVLKRINYHLSPWTEELESNRLKVHQAGPRAFTEVCFD